MSKPLAVIFVSFLAQIFGCSQGSAPEVSIDDGSVRNTPPNLTLIGTNPYTVELGTSFIDPMATADNGEIVESDAASSVDMFVAGDYTVTYRAESKSGDVGVVTRNVLVRHRSQKRGFGYGNGAGVPLSYADLSGLAGKVKWWYDWSSVPEPAIADLFDSLGFSFVPMAWGANFDDTRLRLFLDNAKATDQVLGFNEPNFTTQANLTPIEAALAWPRLEAIARDYNVSLVSPAVNHCSAQCVDYEWNGDTTRAWSYLDAFFALCASCKIDGVAIHWYGSDPERFEDFVSAFEKYNLPIFVTEWSAMGPNVTPEKQMDYLATTVRWMETNPKVGAYSWFIARSRQGLDLWPFNSLLGAPGDLTPLGALYAGLPGENFLHSIPGRIEAEAAHEARGFRHETSDDKSGYVNLCSIEERDQRLLYRVQLQVPGNIVARVRFSVEVPEPLNLLINGKPVTSLEYPASGEANRWFTLEAPVGFMGSGEHAIELLGNANQNLKIDYIEFLYE